MKKFYTQFKLYFVAVLLLAFAGKANAEVTADDLVGTYSFKADLTIVDEELGELLSSDFTFTIAKNSATNLQISGFPIGTASIPSTFKNDTIQFNWQDVNNTYVYNFANINGDNPYGDSRFYLTWKVDSEGNIAIPDFTIVTFVSMDNTPLVAKYTNCVVTKQAEDPKPTPAVSVAGTYTITGTKYDYTNGVPPTNGEASFTLSIDEEGNVYEIAGYEVPEVYGGQGIYGKINGSTFVISPVTNSYLTTGQTYDKLGGTNAYEYDTDASITLSYADGAWTMTDFSVWQASGWPTEYTLKYYWTGLTVTKISDEVVGINAINAQPETGAVYNLQGQKVEKAQKGLYIINGKKVIVK